MTDNRLDNRMSRSSTSILVFGIYLVLLGLILLVFPNFLLGLAGLPLTSEAWIRLVGMLILVLSFYYIQAARNGIRIFYRWTLYTRLSAVFVLLGFVIFELASPVILLFWLGDLAGAIWTWLALRAENSSNKMNPLEAG
jgi:hypothetical protein